MITRKGERAVRVLRAMVEVHYLKDGTFRYSVCEPDSRKGKNSMKKWRERSHGYFHPIPSRERLHSLHYALDEKGQIVDQVGPVETLIAMMKYDVHVMDIRKRKPQPI